jgi:hypothetical protein
VTTVAPTPGSALAGAERETPVGAAVVGAVAGLAGGTAFGAAVAELGNLPAMGLLLLAGSPAIGFGAHILVSALVGAIIGVLVGWARPGPGGPAPRARPGSRRRPRGWCRSPRDRA